MLAQKNKVSSVSPFLALAYGLLIVYGSLYPFSGWLPAENALAFLTAPWPRYIIRSDIITNILIYMPMGLLIARALRHSLQSGMAAIVATVLCLLLSLSMESLQSLLPDRVSSILDLFFNGLGGLGGALLSRLMITPPGPLRKVAELRREWFLPGRAMDLGLVVFGLWALSQVTPLLLALDNDNLRKGLLPLWTPGFPLLFNWTQLTANICLIAGLGLFGSILTRPEKNTVLTFISFVSAVLTLKVLVMGRYLAMETGVGAILGMVLVFVLHGTSKPIRSIIGGLALLIGFALAELEPAASVIFKPLQTFNWIPFHGRMHNIVGFSEILALFWPFLAVGCLGAFATKSSQRRIGAIIGGILVLVLMFVLEWQQQTIPGRRADITDILLALAGWSLPWWWRIHTSRGHLNG